MSIKSFRSVCALVVGGLGVVSLVSGCAVAPGSSSSPQGSTDDSTLASAGGSTNVPAASEALQVYAQLATEDKSATCSSANGALGEITVINLSTGKGATVAGAAAGGTVSLNGASGSAGVALGDAATWSYTDGTFTFSGGAALVGQIALPVSGAAPTTAAEAQSLFDAAFGTAAAYGITIASEATGPLNKVVGFYGTGTTTITSANGGGTATAEVAIGVISYQGKLVAVQTIGMGALASYVQ